jgi:MFS transporter, Spinster family, sphingosine-1-phosphate transporter
MVAASDRYKNFLLVLLLVILAFNYVDRFALGLVIDNIKADLNLTDSQLGFLNGIAFALFYSVMGIPIARWADRGNRVTIISLTAIVWSALVVLSGMATSFAQLLLIRVGVGVGEAGCIPPAHSLIADYFTRAERPRASALYQQGPNVSLIIAYFGAGWISQFYGWRVMFVVVGLPGLVLAALAWFTIREPRKQTWHAARATRPTTAAAAAPAAADAHPDLRTAFVTLWGNETFRHLLYAFSLYLFFGYGVMQWQPAFFERSYGLKTGELGTWFAIVYGIGGLSGVQLGGYLASRFAASNESLQLKAMVWINAVFNGVVWAAIYLTHNPYVGLALMGLSTFGGTTINGPLYSTVQTLIPAPLRAMSIAIVLFCGNLVGMGLGPLAAGVLSDALRPAFGQESLRYALLCVCPSCLWLSWHLWRAHQCYNRDYELIRRGFSTDAAGDVPKESPA